MTVEYYRGLKLKPTQTVGDDVNSSNRCEYFSFWGESSSLIYLVFVICMWARKGKKEQKQLLILKVYLKSSECFKK